MGSTLSMTGGWRGRLGVMGLLAMSALGCALPGGTTVTVGGEIVEIEGVLGADNLDCIWIREASGGKRFLMLNNEVQVKLDPLRLVTEDGTVLTAGERIRLTGVDPDGGGSICGPGIPFAPDTIEPAARG